MKAGLEVGRRWSKYAEGHFLGKKIVAVRYLTDKEQESLGWDQSAVVLQLDDGTLIFPSQDDEGNGAGALFGQTKDGKEITCPVI
jgi:hypothetical protein